MDNIEIKKFANSVRKNILFGAYSAGSHSAHIGGAMSVVDILSAVYCLANFDSSLVGKPSRDRIILSKGHACLALYGCLIEKGVIKRSDLKNFETSKSYLFGHPVMNKKKGIEFSTGSLGMGLSLGVGVAIAAKNNNQNYKTFVVQGDGECNEGSVWEAAMIANQKKLNNLIVLIDRNNFQQTGTSDDILNLNNLKDKWNSFGWETQEIDGHNLNEIRQALKFDISNRPKAIIANTIKGKGLKIAENNNNWHHTVLTAKDYEKALSDLDEI